MNAENERLSNDEGKQFCDDADLYRGGGFPDRVMLATWVSGRFSYAVCAPAMTVEEVEAIVAAMK